LKELDCEDAIPKLEEHKIDAEVFWNSLEEKNLEELLGIKQFGKKKKFMKKRKNIYDEYMKKKEKEH